MSVSDQLHSVTEQFLPSQSSIDIRIDSDAEDADESDVCRRCSLAISEGHAYELGGDRWHTYCFSCSKCSKMLGTSSNFLVLGNGDLICSECSYNCNACGKKIDDIAILTGDQAYCSSCFCCRNCKNRIQDLRYARTTKGLFCMSCHEKLLERKKRAEEIKKIQRLSRYPSVHKSLPTIPGNGSNGKVMEKPSSPEFDSDTASTPGILEPSSTMTVTSLHEAPKISKSTSNSSIPVRSPNRNIARPTPSIALEPSPALTPEQQTPSEFESNQLRTPLNIKSPFKTPQSVAKEHRAGIVVDSLSQGSTSSNIFQGYLSNNNNDIVLNREYLNDLTRRSPPPAIPLPMINSRLSVAHPDIADDDFIDMNDSDEFNEDFNKLNFDVDKENDKENQSDSYSKKPRGFADSRSNVDNFPRGLNIKGLNNFNDQFDDTLKHEYSDISLLPPNSPSPSPYKHIRQQPAQPLSSPSYPLSQESPQLQPLQNSSLLRSKSIKSPKNFLNFRKHRKTSSQSSIEKNTISSPIQESLRPSVIDNLSTPKSQDTYLNSRSPLSGTSLFRTQPIPEDDRYDPLSRPGTSNIAMENLGSGKRGISSHGRSRSDANPIDSSAFELNNLELEARAIRLEILDLNHTKSSLVKEISDLNSVKDDLSLEVATLMRQLDSLKSSSVGIAPTSSSTSTGAPPHSNMPSPVYQGRELQVSAEEDKKSSSSKRFWKRGNIFNRGESNSSSSNGNISHSQSNYSISGIMGHSNNSNEEKQGFHISAPILKTEDADELGGNDNKKLASSGKYLDILQVGNNGVSAVNSAPSSSSAGFTTKQSNGSWGVVSDSSLIMSDLFNSTLEMRAQYEKRDIPIIITRLVEEIEKTGLKSEGLYRKNGSTLQMNIVLKAFNNLYQSESSSELDQLLDNSDINTLTSSLKRYLYFHLPEGIITNHLYQSFIDAGTLSSDDQRAQALANVVSQLPATNQKVLKFILDHLSNVETYKAFNKMTFRNLSVVFASSFLRINDHERELADVDKKNNTTEFLITHYKKIWGEE